MPYDQKNQAGRGPKQKTGAGVPSALLQQAPDEKRGNDPDPLLTEYKTQYPNSTVWPVKNKPGKYKVESGNSSFTVSRSVEEKNKNKA